VGVRGIASTHSIRSGRSIGGRRAASHSARSTDLHPDPTDLGLSIAAAQVLDVTARQGPAEIAGEVDPIGGEARGGVGDESLRSANLVVPVPQREIARTNPYLSDLSEPELPRIGPEHQDLNARDAGADRHGSHDG
jgi:hypothetical protein